MEEQNENEKEGTAFMRRLKEETAKMTNVEERDEESNRYGRENGGSKGRHTMSTCGLANSK